MTKYNKHQLVIICLISFLIGHRFYTDIPITEIMQFTELIQKSLLIFLSFILISTLGVSHGALDGKIIWDEGDSLKNKIKIYSIYTLIVAAGGLLWFKYPFAGLQLLLLLSVLHFGMSDLKFLGEANQTQKISWGFIMTFAPIAFHKERANEIFYSLTNNSFDSMSLLIINYLLFTAIFLYIISASQKIMVKRNSKLSDVLTFLELGLLVVLAYMFDPIVWFAIYFCFLHGIRAIIQLNFKWYPDIVWMTIFTSPVIFFILSIDNNYHSNHLLIVFPILACLTNAHMLLPQIIKFIKG